MAITGLVWLLHSPAEAATVHYSLNGAGINARLSITYGPATDAKYTDAHKVTAVSGTFSNATLGIVDAAIGALVPSNHATPHATNLLAPDEFSRFAVASGLPPENGGFLSFDNLYWPGGSPQTASDYPFHGGFLDIYGLMFEIGDGKVVNFWSNGDFGGGPDYGVAVASAEASLDYVGSVGVAQVPLPGALWLLAGGLAGLVAVRRRAVTG